MTDIDASETQQTQPADINAPKIYASQLSQNPPSYLGHPMWDPLPNESQEVMIGDVGFISKGRFCRLFNATDGSGYTDSSQVFQHLVYDDRLLDFRDRILMPGPFPSASVKILSGEAAPDVTFPKDGKGPECTFTCQSQEGAILVLKEHARRLVVVPNKRFINYVRDNNMSWHRYAEERGHPINPEDIILVRGWIKTSEWATVAFEGRSRVASISGKISAEPAGFRLQIDEDNNMRHMFNTGPEVPDPSSGSPENRPELPATQCIFLSYYKIKYRQFMLPPKIAAAAGPAHFPGKPDDDHQHATPISPSDVHQTEVSELSLSYPSDPVDVILNYILAHSNAIAAIASDGDIEALFLDEEMPANLGDYLEVHTPLIVVDEEQENVRHRRQQNHREELPWVDIDLPGGVHNVISKDPFAVSMNGFSLVPSHSRKQFIAESANAMAPIRDVADARATRAPSGNISCTKAVAHPPDDQLIATGSLDRLFQLWRLNNELCLPLEQKAAMSLICARALACTWDWGWNQQAMLQTLTDIICSPRSSFQCERSGKYAAVRFVFPYGRNVNATNRALEEGAAGVNASTYSYDDGSLFAKLQGYMNQVRAVLCSPYNKVATYPNGGVRRSETVLIAS